ncbi:RNA-directed DNA polymerase [Ramlibacter sp. USB13]|uniref:RNA-directed DNA polymerase n=1 Tax=Ramlibacter cellulosilyticus TaxID=2764187 RepID=A0A923MNK1_9BURK|nr:RNA-directed DNA polymerase [Ramlibacter cellulosilyticus]MBC5782310.1 RNA-directed DNA polymerase [Ramlibacter cellulosilyticus]
MALVKKKYDRLAPRRTYLGDPAVLAQAWKKAHSYIRRHNWYADTLELDYSGVCLDALLETWSRSITSGEYRTAKAKLVPAPKSEIWGFSDEFNSGWAPLNAKAGELPVLRPLAHLGIREQTVATAVMLCLADCIESAQGDTATRAEDAAGRGVFSYGNRLFCGWAAQGRLAQFAWGNSDVYSRYFQDYQRYIDRPLKIAQQIPEDADEVVYVAKLDITAFFDNIDLSRLISVLRSEYRAFSSKYPQYQAATNQFWEAARKALTFQWSSGDRKLGVLFQNKELPGGLPQGLVPSGFFANAYLLDFDRAMGRSIGREVQMEGMTFTLHDYCRYVDDLRLVVAVRGGKDEAGVQEALAQWVDRRLGAHTSVDADDRVRLRINGKKTEVERFSAIGKKSSTAARMAGLQQQLSGPFDLSTLQQTEAGLSGLLSLAELSLKEQMLPEINTRSPQLAAVARTTLEVRDDTLTRFSAFRLVKSLRLRRGLTDLMEPEGQATARQSLLFDFEAAARRLISAWALNPSLVQVLRYALDLYPSPDLLQPVSDALVAKLGDDAATEYERRVVFYVLAELFKAGATETGKNAYADTDLGVGDVVGYRLALADLAQACLQMVDLPWYVQQQASLLLASVGHALHDLPASPELKLHILLHDFLRKRYDSDSDPQTAIVVSLVGHQLRGDDAHYLAWFKQFSARSARSEVGSALRIIGEVSPGLFQSLAAGKRRVPLAVTGAMPVHLVEYARSRAERVDEPLPNGTWLPFSAVVVHPSSPFAQENALLRLAFALTASSHIRKAKAHVLTPVNIRLRSGDWGSLNDPRTSELEVVLRVDVADEDPVYATPSWCDEEDAWMYALGRLLRSAATGEPDFTARRWLLAGVESWYQGITSTWQKRRIGLLNTGNALRGSEFALTPWISELLLRLLRWPGIAQRTPRLVGEFTTFEQLHSIVKDRLQSQLAIYGRSSGVPIYRYPVIWPLAGKEFLRVAVVQGLMPQHDDFLPGLSAFDAPSYRGRHRSHTASLLHLASRHLATRDQVLEKCEAKPYVDLVLFPELSVHVGDQDLMRAFSDSTGAMLFYGVLGALAPTSGKPTNIGRWLIPQRDSGRRSWIEVDQGKWHLTPEEKTLGFVPWRPYQVIIELQSADLEPIYRISGSICYDATDLCMAADLRDQSHMYVVSAMNKDIKTFDSMVSALRYHMYQHVLVANIGEFGGSTAQAPYDLEHRRLIAHSHGGQQISVSLFDVRINDFGPKLEATQTSGAAAGKMTRIGKTPPAGLRR